MIFHSMRWIIYSSYASAHAHDSSNRSYVSMNMDSVNNHKLFSLLHPDIYRSFLTTVFMSQQLVCWSHLSLQVPTFWLRVVLSHKMILGTQTALTVAAPEPSLVLCSLLSTSCSFNLYVTYFIIIIINMCICIISTLRWCAITLCDMEKYHPSRK